MFGPQLTAFGLISKSSEVVALVCAPSRSCIGWHGCVRWKKTLSIGGSGGRRSVVLFRPLVHLCDIIKEPTRSATAAHMSQRFHPTKFSAILCTFCLQIPDPYIRFFVVFVGSIWLFCLPFLRPQEVSHATASAPRAQKTITLGSYCILSIL